MPRGASSGKPSARSGESRGEEEHTLTAVAARLEREAESFAAASTASVNAVNADDEPASSDDDDPGPPVTFAKRNDGDLRVDLPDDPPASIAAKRSLCSSDNPLWAKVGWSDPGPLPHKALDKDAPSTRFRMSTNYKACIEALESHSRAAGVTGGDADGGQPGIMIMPAHEVSLWKPPHGRGGGMEVALSASAEEACLRDGWELVGKANKVRPTPPTQPGIDREGERTRGRASDGERDGERGELDGAISECLPKFEARVLPDGRRLSKVEHLIHVWEHAWTPSGEGASRHAPLRMWTPDRRKEAWAGRADARKLSNCFGELLKAYWGATHPEGLPDGIAPTTTYHDLRTAGGKMLGTVGDRFERVAEFARARAREGRVGGIAQG